jgi:hypothetical protein
MQGRERFGAALALFILNLILKAAFFFTFTMTFFLQRPGDTKALHWL